MHHLSLILAFFLVQDTPTPGGKETEKPKFEGTSGSLAVGSSSGGNARTADEGAALGLRVKANMSGKENSALHAIAEVRPVEGETTTMKGPIVYGFCAVVDEAVMGVDKNFKPTARASGRYVRAELYLYRPGTAPKDDRKTRSDKRPKEKFYHAIVEGGRLVFEKGDRSLLKEFSSAGSAAWFAPFKNSRIPKGVESLLGSPRAVAKKVMSNAVKDMMRGRKGRPDAGLKKFTRVWRKR